MAQRYCTMHRSNSCLLQITNFDETKQSGRQFQDFERARECRAFARSTACGRICIGRRKIILSQVFAWQNAGIKEVAEKIWLVSFTDYDLGFFDHEAGRVECAPSPFGAKLLPMSPE
jgi:hypothetical protein